MRLSALAGWRRAAVLAAAGATATLALPPIHLVPLLWLSFGILALTLDNAATRRRAFFDGFWFGWAHFASGVYWIANALLIDAAKFGWMIPFAILGLGAVLAIFVALAALLAREIAPPGLGRVLALAAAWGFFEWVRCWIFTGFPWNLIGTVWQETLPVAQFASVAGALGLGVLTVAVAAMPAALVRGGHRNTTAFVLSLAALALAALWGWQRIPDGAAPTFPGVKLRLVQANIGQLEKYLQAKRAEDFLTHIELTRGPGFDAITDAIWPETATPYLIEHDDKARAVIANAVPKDGLIITGAPRATPQGQQPFQIWNSLEAVNGEGEIVATYDKSHLVPFGEYVPFRSILPIANIVGGPVDFTSGPGPRTIDLPGLPPAGPLICYEAIFPGHVVDPARRPDWLLNITNDGWYGISAGPYQHFAAARMRAIEEGLPLVRAANTGISAFVDPYGRVTASLPLGSRGVVDGALPKPLAELTLFARWGNATALVLMAIVAVAGFLLGRRSLAR